MGIVVVDLDDDDDVDDDDIDDDVVIGNLFSPF